MGLVDNWKMFNRSEVVIKNFCIRPFAALITLVLVSQISIPKASYSQSLEDSIEVNIFEGNLQASWSYYPSTLSFVDRSGNTYDCDVRSFKDCSANQSVSYIQGTVVFPPCVESNDGPCIEKLELRKSKGEWITANLVRTVRALSRPSDTTIGFPTGGSMSLWSLPEVPNSTGKGDYAIYVRTSGLSTVNGSLEFGGVTGPYGGGIVARVIPYKLESGNFPELKRFTINSSTGKKGFAHRYEYSESDINSGALPGPELVWSDQLGRGIQADWVSGSGARITLRVPRSVTGWLGGRVGDLEFDLAQIDSKLNRLVLGGSALAVDEIQLRIPANGVPLKLREVYPQSDIRVYMSNGSQHKVAFRVIDSLREYTKDRATKQQFYWGFENADLSKTRCLSESGSLMGVVTTNALAYTNSAPTFESGRLKYAVSGMHYDFKGEIIKGTYDLVLRSDAARCLYGFSNAPIEASVAVTYGDKEKNVSTTLSGERNGWLFVSAKNFTFSNPTIEVELSQSKRELSSAVSPTPRPTAVSPTAIASSSKKRTITCLKGKVVKKVTATAPKCPAGFRKRA